VDLLIVLLFVAFLVVVGVLGIRIGREFLQHYLTRESHTFESRVLEELEILRLRLDILSHRLDSLAALTLRGDLRAPEDVEADDAVRPSLRSEAAPGAGTGEEPPHP
jgi:hypothetical protein